MGMTSPVVTATSDILASHHNTLREDVIRNAGIYAVTAGTGSVYTLTIDSAYTSYVAGDKITCKVHEINTLGATLNVNSIGALNIVGINGNAILPGVLLKDSIAEFVYDGTSLVYMGTDMNPDIFRDTGGVITYTDDISMNAEVLSSTTIRIIRGATNTYKNGTSQSIGRTTIWASANTVGSAIIVGGYIYTYLINTAAEARVYRCLVTADISNVANWTQITISGATLGFATGTEGIIGHDGTNFYTTDAAGYRKFTLSGTTFTFVSTVTVTGANYSALNGRINHVGIYAHFTASPNFRFASLAGVLDTNRQCGASATQGFCTKNAFYVSGNNNIYTRNFL